jgi:hypothetical protein
MNYYHQPPKLSLNHTSYQDY